MAKAVEVNTTCKPTGLLTEAQRRQMAELEETTTGELGQLLQLAIEDHWYITPTYMDTEQGGRVVWGPIEYPVEFMWQHRMGDGADMLQRFDPATFEDVQQAYWCMMQFNQDEVSAYNIHIKPADNFSGDTGIKRINVTFKDGERY